MAKFADIITAIRKDLVAANVLGSSTDINRIIPTARVKVPKLTGEADILIRVSALGVQTSVEGSGREFTKIRRVIEIIPRTRSASDEQGKDANWLIDDTYGHLELEERIIDRLQLFQPTTKDQSAFLLVEPMRLVGIGSPNKEADPDGKWGASVQQWEVVYAPNFSATLATDQEHG